jgi:hypothetical protein
VFSQIHHKIKSVSTRLDHKEGTSTMPLDSSTFETRLFINNEFVPSLSGKTFDTVNPATEEVICGVYEAEEADVDVAGEWLHERYATLL